MRRHAAGGTGVTDADISLRSRLAATNLANTSTIIVNGQTPFVDSLTFASAVYHNRTFGLDDQIKINVTFSQEVLAIGGPPVLVLDTGRTYRDAVYSGGNGSDTLQFVYTVKLGDYALARKDGGTNRHGLSFRHPQVGNALCRKTGCPADSETEATIIQKPHSWPAASGRELDAELTLSIPTGAADTSSKTIGVPIEANASVYVDARESRPTHVVSDSMNSRGSLDDNVPYGVGENFYIDVQFSDEVKISGTLPTFYLSTGAYALFDSGENTDTLTFFYRPAAGETTSRSTGRPCRTTLSLARPCTRPSIATRARAAS